MDAAGRAWLHLNDVYKRVKKCVGDQTLALHDIKDAILSGSVASMERWVARSGGEKGQRELSVEFWQRAKVTSHDDGFHRSVTVRSDEQQRDKFQYHYFLKQSDVEKTWPIDGAAVAATNETRPLWPLKSSAGRKSKHDWEKILIKAAGRMYGTSIPESLADLRRYIEDNFRGEPPSETQLESHLDPLYREFKRIDGK